MTDQSPQPRATPRANSGQGEGFMNRLTNRYRAAAVAVVVAAIAAIVGLAPHLGFTNTTAPLWSERTVAVVPAAAVPAPNWVELAKTLKPAVVNISTKRVDEHG